MADFPAWGLHVTTSSIRAVKLARSGDEVRVVAHDQAEFSDDVADITSLDKAGPLLHALAQFAKRHDLGRSRLIVSVDATTAFNRFVSTALVQGETLEKILAYEAQQQIPFGLEEVYWDYKSVDVQQEAGEAEVMIFAVRKEITDERLRRLEKMHIPADGAQLSPVALYNYAAAEDLARDGTVIVSVDFDRVEIVVVHGRRFWFRVLPTGTHVLHEELAERLGERHRVVAKVLRGEVEPSQKPVFNRVAQEFAARLASQIHQVVSYFAGAADDLRLDRIILVPGGAPIPGLVKALKEKSLLQVELLPDPSTIVLDPAIATPDIERSFAPYAHAAGLALQGLGIANTAVRLHPDDLERTIAGRRVFHVLSALTLLLLVALMALKVHNATGTLKEDAKILTEKLGEVDSGRQAFESKREEAKIKDEMMPFREPGRHRTAAADALSLVLETLGAANEGRDADHRYYVVSMETRSQDPAKATTPGCRKVEIVIGMVQLDGVEGVVQDLKSGLATRFDAAEPFSNVQLGASWQASALSPTATPNIEVRELRRKFVMVPISLDFSPETGGMGDGGHG